MNLFKVLASGKKSFLEEQASAIIAWFMNPRMEHGLGFLFLSRFVKELQIRQSSLDEVSSKLFTQLRSDSDTELKWSCKLEYNVEDAFIDIALFLDDWIISIENKIYPGSASDEKQLVREYEGLKRKHNDKKLGMIFLVPYSSNDGDNLDIRVQLEYDALPEKLDGSHFKQIVTWQKNNISYPSISAIIEGILEDEAKGLIEPIPEYTRHTLKAFNVFINSDFEGYYYNNDTRYSCNNENTEDNLDISEISKKVTGYVGVQNGLSGLMLMDKNKLKKHKFQFTSTDMSSRRNWIELEVFLKISAWLLHGTEPDIIWNVVLPSRLLYKIVKECQNSKVHIGIRGGLKALEGMTAEEIISKRWAIKTTDTPPTSQWIEGSVFRDVIERKQVYLGM